MYFTGTGFCFFQLKWFVSSVNGRLFVFPYALHKEPHKESLSSKEKVFGTVVAPLQSVSTDTQQHSSGPTLSGFPH